MHNYPRSWYSSQIVYVEAHNTFNIASAIFGVDGWSSTVMNLKQARAAPRWPPSPRASRALRRPRRRSAARLTLSSAPPGAQEYLDHEKNGRCASYVVSAAHSVRGQLL